ncbi:hypothetical protein [uncultured Mediterranean phage]|nr:hypothetical protein [uncultured Mediterranean phage]
MAGLLETRAASFNLAAPGADTGALTALTPRRNGAFRVTVALTTASVFNVTCTDGTTTHKWGLNQSVTLQAGDLYTFVFGVSAALAYNFEVETDSIIEILQVDEIDGGEL